MHVGHVNLAKSFDGTGAPFVGLVEALEAAGVRQYVLVRNVALAKRLDATGGAVVGPVLRSAVTACCLMPAVDVVHVHGAAAGRSGLLLTLTRSIPYVLSHDGNATFDTSPLARAVYRRALCVLCPDDGEASIVRHFDPSLKIEIVSEMGCADSTGGILRVYQNSQRMPIAGNSGIQ